MRPSRLDQLFAPLTSLKGIASKGEVLLEKLFNRKHPRLVDALLHLPSGVIDRRASPPLNEVKDGQLVTIKVRVEAHRPPTQGRFKAPYKVVVSDNTGDLTLLWFQGFRSHLEKLLPIGEERIISGRVEFFDGSRQMSHPERVLREEEAYNLPMIEPNYPLTAGVNRTFLSKMIKQSLPALKRVQEWQDAEALKQKGWVSFEKSLTALHSPTETDAFDENSIYHQRLTYDELLAQQLALALVRAKFKATKGRVIKSESPLKQDVEAALPFTLTPAQTKAVDEIINDLNAETRMHRLLQGDVGAGKTAVALLAMCEVVGAGKQAALMAPTEILARQHFETFTKILAPFNVKVQLLTGRDKGKERVKIYEALKTGEINIAIGTHALFQEAVEFKDLAFVVIDEQHRFGVSQRLLLAEKGEKTDVLVMTATPIPRTLVMTWFGDMDVSLLSDKPKGRKPIQTLVIHSNRLGEVVAGLARKIKIGAQVYWVCPLVSESEELDIQAAIARYEDLQKFFGDEVGLLHGQMKASEKDAVMARFKANELKLLVSTTVIEVGVDVPNATIMVIEEANRFGLAQLHQLRGRVGRGAEASTCFLLYKDPLGQVAKQRLEMMRVSEDGFLIAEKDLELRGQGEVLGNKQSGDPAFKLAKISLVKTLLPLARNDAKLIMTLDPNLETERGEALRDLLYLLGKDEMVKLFKAG